MPSSSHIKVAVDAIIFGYAKGQLQLLLIKRKYRTYQHSWALVGGFVHAQESLLAAVHREVQEEAGISVSYLAQLYTFGDEVGRDPRGRVISVAYMALVNSTQLSPRADTDAAAVQWFDVSSLPELAFDHAAMVQLALARLRSKIRYEPIGFDLLPPTFLFSDVEQLYTTILATAIDRRNFRKKILSVGLIEETPHFALKKSGRPAKLYQFNKAKYQQLQQEGFALQLF